MGTIAEAYSVYFCLFGACDDVFRNPPPATRWNLPSNPGRLMRLFPQPCGRHLAKPDPGFLACLCTDYCVPYHQTASRCRATEYIRIMRTSHIVIRIEVPIYSVFVHLIRRQAPHPDHPSKISSVCGRNPKQKFPHLVRIHSHRKRSHDLGCFRVLLLRILIAPSELETKREGGFAPRQLSRDVDSLLALGSLLSFSSRCCQPS